MPHVKWFSRSALVIFTALCIFHTKESSFALNVSDDVEDAIKVMWNCIIICRLQYSSSKVMLLCVHTIKPFRFFFLFFSEPEEEMDEESGLFRLGVGLI